MRPNPQDALRSLNGACDFLDPQRTSVGKIGRCTTLSLQYLRRNIGADNVDEIFHIARYMETHIVTLQQARHYLPLPRKNIENVGAGECRMVEECNFQIRSEFPQIRRHHPQVVIVYPDRGAFGRNRCRSFRKAQSCRPAKFRSSRQCKRAFR